MNTTVKTDEVHEGHQEKPGFQLARAREKKGYSQEYVAGRLHLRTRVIELLDADDYEQLPPPVFIQGYLSAYAKFLDVPAEPLVKIFNSLYSVDRKVEKALWQSKRESNKGERLVRVLTALIVVGAIAVVSFWWQKNKDSQQLFSTKSSPVLAKLNPSKMDSELRLTDLSKLHSLLNPPTVTHQISPRESPSGG